MGTRVPTTASTGGSEPAPSWRPTRHDRAALARQTSVLLRELGHDPVTVAMRLAGAGVQGEPADARGCALAVYLRAVMTADSRVSGIRVFHDRVVINSPGRLAAHRVSVHLPPPLRAFVTGFDARRYPALVRAAIPGDAAGGRSRAPVALPGGN